MLEPDAPMIDDYKTEFVEWQKDEDKVKIIGTRHKVSGEPNGIVRMIDSNGDVTECTMRDGLKHGLLRKITAYQIILEG